MRSWWFVISVLVLVVLVVVGGYLYYARWSPSSDRDDVEQGGQELVDEALLEETQQARIVVVPPVEPISRQGRLGTLSMGLLQVEEMIVDEVVVNGKQVPRATLVLLFTDEFEGYRIRVPLVGDVQYSEYDGEGNLVIDGTKTPTSASDLPLVWGDVVGVSFIYLPLEEPMSQAGLEIFCSTVDIITEACNYGLESGFGNQPVEPLSYVKGELERGPELVVDYALMIPTNLTK